MGDKPDLWISSLKFVSMLTVDVGFPGKLALGGAPRQPAAPYNLKHFGDGACDLNLQLSFTGPGAILAEKIG